MDCTCDGISGFNSIGNPCYQHAPETAVRNCDSCQAPNVLTTRSYGAPGGPRHQYFCHLCDTSAAAMWTAYDPGEDRTKYIQALNLIGNTVLSQASRGWNTAIFAGSFKPFTKGHLSVVMEGLKLFSHVRILAANNPDKKQEMSPEEVMQIIEASVGHLPNVSWDHTSDFVYLHARSIGARFLLRGLRNASEGDYELHIAGENKKLAPDLQTVFVAADPILSNISSSELRTMHKRGQDILPYCVNEQAHQLIKQALP